MYPVAVDSSAMSPHAAVTSAPLAALSARRLAAAVARVSLHYSRALDSIGEVIGECDVATVLQRRVDALSHADAPADMTRAAVNLHQLVVWLAAIAESIELESPPAADLRVNLAAMIAECDLIATPSA